MMENNDDEVKYDLKFWLTVISLIVFIIYYWGGQI